MATITGRPKDNPTVWTVSYRFGGRGSKQGGLNFNDEATALAFKATVEAVGAEQSLRMNGVDPTPRSTRTGLTVAGWVRKHIDQLTGVEQYTLDKYEAYLKNDIIPAFGDLPLTALSEDDIAAWVKHMETHGGRKGDGHSPKTIRNKYGFLSGALNAAVPKHIATNPAANRRLPRGDAEDNHDMRMLSRDEFRRLYDATADRWKPMLEFLVASGTRWGEAAALQPRHIDVESGLVMIRQAWKYSPTKGYTLGPPKTKRSRRNVEVPTRLLEKLDLSGEFVFTNRDGGPVRYPRFWRHVWNPAVAKAELDPRPTPHDLRHTFASWHLSGGTPITVVSRQMGHENISVTADTYADIDRASSRTAAEFMDKMLG